MSKFVNIMHLLDMKNKEIKNREFPDGTRPFRKHQVCWIPIKMCELNSKCEKCAHAGVITTKGKVTEFGIDGYMSNQKDPFKKIKYTPSMGVKLKEPSTIIIAQGEAWACKHRLQRDFLYLTEKQPTCMGPDGKTLFEEKIEKKK